MIGSTIKGLGTALPEKILTNQDLERMVDTSDEWITTRTGIKERRITDSETASSDLAAQAAEKAIAESGIDKKDIDMIIVGTVTPDTLFPSTACVVQAKLGLPNIPAFDILAACPGWLYALTIADSFIKSGKCRNVIAIGVETLTKITNWEDRNTCVLFGDGAGAAVLSKAEEGDGLLHSSFISANGSLGHLLVQPAGGSRMPASKETVEKNLHTVHMAGSEVFKNAVKFMANASKMAIKEAGLTPEDIDWVIPHQANIRIIESLAKKLRKPMDRVIVTIEKYGNTSSSTIPIALREAIDDGRIKRGDKLLFVSFGGGFTWGAVVITY